MRDAVSGRLGYDPFLATAERAVSVHIRRTGSTLIALVELLDATGQVIGRRELSSPGNDCAELASAMALAISIAIDPLVMVRAPAPAKVLPPNPPPRPSPQPAPPPPARRQRGVLRASIGALATLGAAPAIGAGFTAQVGLRYGLFSIGVEGRVDLPSSMEVALAGPVSSSGVVKSSLLLAALVPCIHYRFFAGCGLGSVGALLGASEQIKVPMQGTSLYAAVGARVGAEIQLYRVLWLRPHLDVLATLTPITLQINKVGVWTTPPVSGDLGLDVLGVFP